MIGCTDAIPHLIPKALEEVLKLLIGMQAIVLERPVFVREQSDGLYRVITYLTFKVLEEVVLALTSSVAFSLLVYYLVKLQGSFFVVWIVFLVTQLVGVGETVSRLQPLLLLLLLLMWLAT